MKRNLSIDIFRGLTMLLMIFVNDFWTVLDVPHGLEHFATFEDGMGLSDWVFPMFLFAMGMSVPYAIDRRFAKGFSATDTLRHIFGRTFALLVMGTFIVNSEGGFAPLLGYSKGVWWLLMLLGFFLIWNQKTNKWLRAAGVAVLLFLAVTFRTPDGELFRASWWGILGQIGWMYLFTALAYLICREGLSDGWKSFAALLSVWILLCLVNLSVVPMRDGEQLLGGNFLSDCAAALHLGNGHSAIMSLGGMLLILGERKASEKGRSAVSLAPWGFALAAVLAAAGDAAHSSWIISKNLGTLPWCLYVSAISVALYVLLRILEQFGLTGWFRPFAPAGTATLTVYMIPYIFYSLWVFCSPEIPAWLSGGVGVLKCGLFSILCLGVAHLTGRAGLKLKI